MRPRITSVGLLIPQDLSASFEYPRHIDRASLDALPARPGIYIFRDPQGVALYIGKSVNIRSRVLSHLRCPDEAKMLMQSSHIEFERTAGEIGALLLESRLIKQVQPLYNVQLRRSREMCSLHLPETGISGPAAAGKLPVPEVVFARESDFASTDHLYGLFATRRAALEMLRAIVEEHQLCPALTGLEAISRGRACFSRQIGRCRGACIGHETPAEHTLRLRTALQNLRVMVWPHQGAIGIVEESDGWRQTHVVDHWFYLGSISHGRKQAEAKALLCNHSLPRPAVTRHMLRKKAVHRDFDADTYKILVGPMLAGTLQLQPYALDETEG